MENYPKKGIENYPKNRIENYPKKRIEIYPSHMARASMFSFGKERNSSIHQINKNPGTCLKKINLGKEKLIGYNSFVRNTSLFPALRISWYVILSPR